jgi:3-oxoacyl-[acyl-carrier protein] reductase
MELELRGKRAVITGSSRGIGKAVAMQLAHEGASIALCARGGDQLDATTDEIRKCGVEIMSRACDVGDPLAFDAFLASARETFGGIDILVNNATGFSESIRSEDESWEACFRVDLMGAVRASRRVAKWMASSGGGAIVNVASVSGLEAGGPSAYSALKAALISYTRNAATMFARQGIRVNAVAPGPIEFAEGLWSNVRKHDPLAYQRALNATAWRRLGTPAEVADVVTYLVSGRANWITGQCISVDGGLQRGLS